MSRWMSVVCLLMSSGSVFANDQCADLWFARTAILAQGGYCVGSTLGDEIFGKAECSSDEPELPDFLHEQMEQIAALETDQNCDVDDAANEIEIWQIEVRKQLLIQPVNSGRSARCVMKAPTSLRIAPSPEADQLGWLERGDVILLQYDKAGGADFAARVRRGKVITEDIGWFSGSQCQPL